MIEAHELTRRYGKLLAVDRVSLSVRPGEIVGLLGPNGAGKTTIMKILTGYHFPHSGVALVGGVDVTVHPVAAKARLGYLPESAPTYPELTVNEYLEFVARARGIPRASVGNAIARVIDLCSLESTVERPIGELSKGFRQRVGLAQALIHDPDIVVLDEPTSGLDPNQIQEIREVIRELGREKSVLLSTHILSEVEALCDRVLILDHGRVVAEGAPHEIGRELRGAAVVEVRLLGPVPEAAQEALGRVGRILSLAPSEDGTTAVRLALRDGFEGEAVFDWAVAWSLRVRALSPERYSLEEIFARLTVGGGV